MKYFLLICFLFVMVGPSAVRSQQAPVPLAKDQLMDLVKAGMETPALVKLIKDHGIDFELTSDYLQALRKAGAQEPVIRALGSARPQPLSKDQLLKMVAAGVPSTAARVSQRGVNFVANEGYLNTLRLAGADDALVAAVRRASAAITVELVVRTTASASIFLDGEQLGQADPQGTLSTKSAAGAHTLKVTLSGKKDFEESITLAARQAANIDARLEDLAPDVATVGPQFAYPASLNTFPLADEATAKSRECISMVNIWNSKIQQAQQGGVAGGYSHMQAQMNAVNQERVQTYRTKYMPQLKDLQQKLLQELDRSSSEHLDYSMMQSPLQLLGICNDLNLLASDYRVKAFQGRIKRPGTPPGAAATSSPQIRENPEAAPTTPPPAGSDPRLVATTSPVSTPQPATPARSRINTPSVATDDGIVTLKSATGRLDTLPQIWRSVATNDLYRIRFDSEHIIIFQLKSNQIVADLTLKKGKYVGSTSLSPCQGGGHMEVPSWSPTRIEAKIEVPDANKMCGGIGGFGRAIGRSMVDASFIPEVSAR